MFVDHLACPRCRARHDHRQVHTVCECGTPLLVEYDLDAVRRSFDRASLAERPPTMWRYQELLPLDEPANAVSLGEGMTPLIGLPGFGFASLLVKDEGANPTGTFKARGASCGVSRARELGIREVALPTAGNAGGAWACYGGAAGLVVHVAMPDDAPEINRLECLLYGAEVQTVEGLISDAAAVIDEGVAEHGWFDASTLKEPYRIEGKKTLGLEIAEQLGWTMPDAIVYPAGGGVGLIGIWRALEQLRAIGWVDGSLPRLIVVQARGCAPLVEAFEEGWEESRAWKDAQTIAAGIRVPKAAGDFLVLRALRETDGTAVAVSDESIRRAMVGLARAGIAAAPEGAAALAGALRLRQQGLLRRSDRVVVINTGTALKYPEVIREAL